MKVGVIVVWFNPDREHIKNLELMLEQVTDICIVDNSVHNDNYKLLKDKDVKYIHNSNIGGIAGAFNRGFDYFSNLGDVKNIYTFDQDTAIPNDFFSHMNEFVKNKGAKIACPSFFDTNAKTFGKFVKMGKIRFYESDDDKTHFCISSGMYINIEMYQYLGGFNEKLIIDHVDTEFALKAYVKKIDIYFNKNVTLKHAIGERESKKFLGVIIKPNHHSKIRKYYISRNGTYLAFKYFRYTKSYFVLNVARMIHEYMSVFLYENDKLNKIKAMNRGLVDALKSKLGNY